MQRTKERHSSSIRGLTILRGGLCAQRGILVLFHGFLHHQSGGNQRKAGSDHCSPQSPVYLDAARRFHPALRAFGGVIQESVPATRALNRLHGRFCCAIQTCLPLKNRQQGACYVLSRHDARNARVWQSCFGLFVGGISCHPFRGVIGIADEVYSPCEMTAALAKPDEVPRNQMQISSAVCLHRFGACSCLASHSSVSRICYMIF